MKKGFVFLISILVFGVGAPASAAPPVCNPTTEGTIVYNVDHKVMQYCDGTNWISMRGSAVTTFDSLSCGDGETVEWDSATSKWSCAIDDEGVTTETDPKVDAVTSNKWCRGTGSQVTCDQDAPSGDNLGNHTATTTLALGANAMTSSAGTIRDGNGGWVRTYGNTGWYNGTHGGGWHMSDTTWIRSYGGKWIYTDTGIRADGNGVRTNQICNTGGGNCVAQSVLSGGGADSGTMCGLGSGRTNNSGTCINWFNITTCMGFNPGTGSCPSGYTLISVTLGGLNPPCLRFCRKN